ncbi:hypothetical protein B296_00015852 [Ensete ventricosum]|uniref:Uncharacterized protein n=1 Tax=Ensete ventricosum TaxID=4639 RepID=A0A427AD95_ENSVE|nr:hypothetical protein B296_00015852 [Ensete ventricosum]
MTTASVAAIKYAEEVPCFFTKGLAVSLSGISSTMVFLLLWSTLLHALVWRSLFPNDVAIAIANDGNGGTRLRETEKAAAAKRRYDLKRWA